MTLSKRWRMLRPFEVISGERCGYWTVRVTIIYSLGIGADLLKYASAAQPMASVIATAVLALITFPIAGIHPTKNWDTALPPYPAANVKRRSAAAVFGIVVPCSWAMATIMAVCKAIITGISEPGIWARPPPTKPAEVAAI